MVELLPSINVSEEWLSLWSFFNTVNSKDSLAPGTDAVMVAVPERTPVILPLLDTFATFGLEERYVSSEDGRAETPMVKLLSAKMTVSFVFNFIDGFLTVILHVCFSPWQEAVIFTVPVFWGVTFPLELTLAIFLSEDFQVTLPLGATFAFKVTGFFR